MSQTFVDTRQPGDQTVVRAIADRFLQTEDRALLSSETGRDYRSLKFNAGEYFGLLQLFPASLKVFRRHMMLYRYLLTLDSVLRDMRALYRTLSNLDTIGMDSVFQDLQLELPHPMYVPWDIALSLPFTSMTLTDQARYNLRATKNPRDHATATAYLLRFPIIRGMVALSQGLYYEAPESNSRKWINANMDRNTPGHGEIIRDERVEHSSGDIFKQFRLHNGLQTAPSKDAKFVSDTPAADPLGGPMDTDTHDLNQCYRGIADHLEAEDKRAFPAGNKEKFIKALGDLATAFKQSRAIVHVYDMWNRCMREWNKVMTRTYMTLHSSPQYFASDLLRGPFLGSSLQCEDGTVPRFIGWNGEPISMQRAIIEVDGKQYVSGEVDPSRSGCIVGVEIR